MNTEANWVDVPGMPGAKALATGDARFDVTRDPTTGLDGMPPNMGEYSIPHIYSFQSIYGTMAKVYRASDEAVKHGFDNARFMRNDVTVMECVEMRQRAGCLTDWSIEPEDARNPEHIALCDAMTKIVKKIPRFVQYQENLLHATWYGKYGIEHRWGSRLVGNSMRKFPVQWLPVNGDKIVFRFDDLSGDYRPDQIGIRVSTSFNSKATPHQQSKVMPTDYGMAYFLDSWERSQLAIHKYRIEDGEFEEPSNAGRIHGVGIRSVIYWTWYQKQETLAYLMEYLERSAAGVEIWYYPMGNPQAEAATRTAAQERIGNNRNMILVPKPQGEDAAYYDVQRIEPSMAGAGELKSIITEYFGHAIKRYILGQTLTTEASATGLGSSLADIHMDTFMQIIRYDTMLLEETIDTELLQPLLAYNFPQYAHVEINFRKHLSEPDAEAQLNALKTAYEMGLRLDAQTLRDLIGAVKPEADAEVLDKMEQMKAEQDSQMQAQQAMMPPGGDPNAMEGQEQAPPAASANAAPIEQAEYTAVKPGARRDRHLLVTHDSPVEQYKKFKAAIGQKTLDWNEEDHPRDDDGKFTAGPGGGHEPNFTEGSQEPQNEAVKESTAKPAKIEVDYEDHAGAATEWKEKTFKSKWFKSWFGDWEDHAADSSKVVDADGKPQGTRHVSGEGSKVVDEETGEPMVVFHGTPHGGFNVFDKSKVKSGSHLMYGAGFYFSESRGVSSMYAHGSGSKSVEQSELDEIVEKIESMLPKNLSIEHFAGGISNHNPPRISIVKEGGHPEFDRASIAIKDKTTGRWYLNTDSQSGNSVFYRRNELDNVGKYLYGLSEHPELKELYLNVRNPYREGEERIPFYDFPDDVELPSKVRQKIKAHKQNQADFDKADAEFQRTYGVMKREYGWTDADIDTRLDDAFKIDGEKGYWAQNAYAALRARDKAEFELQSTRDHYGYYNFSQDVGEDRANELLQKLGYDGIVTGGMPGSRSWVVFEPNQIKSVNNRGTFNPDEERIDYAAGFAESQHPRDGDGKFAPIDLTGWDKPIVQPPSIKGQQGLFDEIDPEEIGKKDEKPVKKKTDPNQRGLFDDEASMPQDPLSKRIRESIKRRSARSGGKAAEKREWAAARAKFGG